MKLLNALGLGLLVSIVVLGLGAVAYAFFWQLWWTLTWVQSILQFTELWEVVLLYLVVFFAELGFIGGVVGTLLKQDSLTMEWVSNDMDD